MNAPRATSMRICEHPLFDPNDFAFRWQKARVSALRSALGSSAASKITEQEDDQDLSRLEITLLMSVPSELHDQVIKRVFDSSRQLGISVSRYLGLSLEISDFSEVLAHSKIPCFQGAWRDHNDAKVLERKGCSLLSTHQSFGCDYWREALDGLVMGAGDTERLARHRSLGHGDEECVDVLFTENYEIPRVVSADSPKIGSSSQIRKFGAVPEDLAQALEGLSQRFDSMKVRLHLDGFSEGTLYYRLETDEGVLCGAGGRLLHDSFSKELAKYFPHVRVKDSSPLAVYGGST